MTVLPMAVFPATGMYGQKSGFYIIDAGYASVTRDRGLMSWCRVGAGRAGAA